MKEADRSVKKEQLISNESVFVEGKIEFARIIRHMSPEDIQRENAFIASRPGKSKYPLENDVVATKIAIHNAGVRPKSGNVNDLTPNETYINESLYVSSAKPEKGYCYSLISRGNKLPGLAVPDLATGQFVPLENPAGEPASDLPVILKLRCYYVERTNKWGWNLAAVYFPEGFKAYEPTAGIEDEETLRNVGIIEAMPVTQREAPVATPEQAQQQAAPQNLQGQQFPTPQAQVQQNAAPAPAVAGSAAPAYQPQPAQQPVAAQTAPAGAPVAPPVAGSAFGNAAVPGQQQQVQQPVAVPQNPQGQQSFTPQPVVQQNVAPAPAAAGGAVTVDPNGNPWFAQGGQPQAGIAYQPS